MSTKSQTRGLLNCEFELKNIRFLGHVDFLATGGDRKTYGLKRRNCTRKKSNLLYPLPRDKLNDKNQNFTLIAIKGGDNPFCLAELDESYAFNYNSNLWHNGS